MGELDKILDKINQVSEENLNESMKEHIISNLWNLYYSKKEGIVKSNNDEIYIVNQEPLLEKVNENELKDALSNLIKNKSVTLEEANVILKWVVNNARENLSNLGIDVAKNSLDGYCELAQLITIYPLEKLGFDITKNTAKNTFDYPLNHAFGTVTFKINDNDNTFDKTYLIDITYRQFFTKEKCNKGKYYIGEKPDVGYFVKNKELAKELMKNGYIELSIENAKEYGEAFYKAGLEINQENQATVNYFENIINSKEDYVLSIDNLEGLNINIPKI